MHSFTFIELSGVWNRFTQVLASMVLFLVLGKIRYWQLLTRRLVLARLLPFCCQSSTVWSRQTPTRELGPSVSSSHPPGLIFCLNVSKCLKLHISWELHLSMVWFSNQCARIILCISMVKNCFVLIYPNSETKQLWNFCRLGCLLDEWCLLSGNWRSKSTTRRGNLPRARWSRAWWPTEAPASSPASSTKPASCRGAATSWSQLLAGYIYAVLWFSAILAWSILLWSYPRLDIVSCRSELNMMYFLPWLWFML